MTNSKPNSALNTPGKLLSGLNEIADRYDGYILDLWGTIHNGIEPLPGAVECLKALKAAGKDVLILSNAPRRIGAVVDRMDAVGIPRTVYGPVLSSGEAGWLALRDRNDSWHRRLGERAFLIGEAGDESILQDQQIQEVTTLDEASFLLCVGAFRRSDTVADYELLLADAYRLQLPMMCVNPDQEVLRGPNREICAGAIATAYEDFGGDVHYHGKPYRPIYDLSFKRLSGIDPSRILAVGDSLCTDVAGANAVGIDSLFIVGGILAQELRSAACGDLRADALALLYQKYGQTPNWAAAAFRW